MKQKPVWKPTHTQVAAMMWDHAKLVHEVCVAVDRCTDY